MKLFWLYCSLVVALGLIAADPSSAQTIGRGGFALAQSKDRAASPPTPAAPVRPVATPTATGPTPEQTTASYGDWVLRCDTVGSGNDAHQVCEVVLTMQLRGQQGQQLPAAAIALGRATKTDPLRLTFVFPPDIFVPAAPRVIIADNPRQSIDLVWERCVPLRCFADAVVSDAVLKQLRERTDPGHIELKDAAQHDLSLPLSFRGLASALDALAAKNQAQ